MSPDQMSELVWDSASDQDTATSSETTSEDEGGLQDVPGVTNLQPGVRHPVVKRPAVQ
jgi:hypothetical protein